MAKEAIPVGAYILPSSKEEKMKAVNEAIDKLQHQFKDENIIMNLGSKVGKLIPSYATGIPEFDFHALGCGGFPRGRIEGAQLIAHGHGAEIEIESQEAPVAIMQIAGLFGSDLRVRQLGDRRYC